MKKNIIDIYMSEEQQQAKPDINNIVSDLNTELASILTNKATSDGIVNKLSDVFKHLDIYKNLESEINNLKKRNNELENTVEKQQRVQKLLSEQMKNLSIEKQGLEQQLKNWRDNTAQIMTANIQVLKGLTQNPNNQANVQSQANVKSQANVQRQATASQATASQATVQSQANVKSQATVSQTNPTHVKEIDSSGNIKLVITDEKKTGIHTLNDLNE